MDPEKSHHPSDRIPLHSLSPEEIYQFLKESPGKSFHFTEKKEDELYAIFFNFFIDYFYMQENVSLKDFMNSLERAILVKMLSRFNGNQKETASFLGVNHTTLNQKVRKHRISFFKRPISG